MDLEKLERLALKAAQPDTCDPLLRAQWSAHAPHAGHSRLFALLVEQMYGGSIVYCRHTDHYFNRLPDGDIVDIAHGEIDRQNKDPCADEELTRGVVLTKPILPEITVKVHYDLLWKRFTDALVEEEKEKLQRV